MVVFGRREEEEGRKEKKETRRRQVIGMHGRYGADLGVVKREGTRGGTKSTKR